MRKKIIFDITMVLAMLIIGIALILTLSSCGNRQWFDTTYTFDYAWITLDDSTIIHGQVQSWKDFDNSDMIQVKINGETYLSHSSNIVLRAN